VVLARAGHELPLLLHAGRSADGPVAAEFIGSDGMPLGLLDADMFASLIADRTVPFPVGSGLLLYTDGLTETPNADGREFGSARLSDIARAHAHRGPRAINDALEAEVGRFGDGGLRDDFTILCSQRIGP
jgi:sigma-B regulation protein RsbU (phosphoserine phosphatase)